MNKLLKVITLFLLITGIVLILLFLNSSNNDHDSGYITVIIKNIDNEVVDQNRIKFDEDDTIYDCLNSKYELNYKDDIYGHFLLGIKKGNDFDIQTDKFNNWLWFEVGYLKENAEYDDIINFDDYDITSSNIGIDRIELKNNMILGISERDNNHETSILTDNNENNLNNIINIIGYIIIGLGIILFISLIIFDKDKKSLKVKDICIMALFTAVLFIQEQLLVFLPNIQLTFMLISLYTIVFGVKKTLLIVFIHVILDNMIMGSFTFITMIPMLVGYTILVFLINLVRNKRLPWIVVMACVGSFIYCYMFLIMNKIVYDIDFLVYFISDIPFELLLLLSTILTITYLFRPLEKTLNNLLYND